MTGSLALALALPGVALAAEPTTGYSQTAPPPKTEATTGYSQTAPAPKTETTATTPKTETTPAKKETAPAKQEVAPRQEEAARTTPAATPSKTTEQTETTSTARAAHERTLPFTGLDLRWVVFAGVLLLGSGLSIMLAQRRRRQRS